MRERKRRWTEIEDAELKQLAASGVPRIGIALHLKRSVGAIKQRASMLGVKFVTSTSPNAAENEGD